MRPWQYHMDESYIEDTDEARCEVCGKEIQPYKSGKRVFSPQEIFMESFNKYHKGMCIECGKAAASENAG